MARKNSPLKCWRTATLGLACLALMPLLGAYAIGRWLDYSEKPVRSDIIVVLAGSVSRPFYAADLYKQGYAPELWISRPFLSPAEALAVKIGALKPEEEINRDILIKRGVPARHIHIYGNAVKSTVNEALALAQAADTRGKKILVVTSRFHARRAGLIFRGVLKQSSVRMAATPYETFTRAWWKERALAPEAILEMAKLAFYLAGGRFLSPLEARRNTP